MRQVRPRFDLARDLVRDACRCETEPYEDAAGLMSREVGSVEAGGARDDLLRGISAPTYDHVMFLDGLGEDAYQSRFD
jgi:hypothetical protein